MTPFGSEMSSDACLRLDRYWHPYSGILSGVNISTISKAYQLFGSTIELLALTNKPSRGNKTLQMKLEEDGIVSARSLPYSSSEWLLGETAALVVPEWDIMIRKLSQITPKGYLHEFQLHLSNEYLENIIDNSLVITRKYLPYGQTLIVNDNSLLIKFDKDWQRKEQETNQEGLPFGGTTHETMHVGSSFRYIFTGEWFFFVATTPPQLGDI